MVVLPVLVSIWTHPRPPVLLLCFNGAGVVLVKPFLDPPQSLDFFARGGVGDLDFFPKTWGEKVIQRLWGCLRRLSDLNRGWILVGFPDDAKRVRGGGGGAGGVLAGLGRLGPVLV